MIGRCMRGFLRVMSELYSCSSADGIGIDDFSPLDTTEVAQSAIYMLGLPPHLSVKALDVVSTGLFSASCVYSY